MKKQIFKQLAVVLVLLLTLTALASCFAGKQGPAGPAGPQGEQGVQGAQGAAGKDGANGNDGKSAFELAVEKGYTGTLDEWLAALKGDAGENGTDGKSAFELAVEKGYTGTLDEWLASLKGDAGADGKSAFELAVEKGYTGTLDEWLAAMKGDAGADGKSAFELAVEKGYTGTLDEWLAALKGDAGVDGKSAYQLYCEAYDYTGTEEQWLADLISGQLVEYTITFDLNGGVAGAGFQQSISVPGGTLATLSTPTKTGYTFIGWYTGDGVNDGIFTTTTPVKQDFQLKARWRANQMKVSFLDYYGNLLKLDTVDYGTAATAPEAPKIDKLKFSAWDVDFSAVKSDLTVKPIYVSDTYTLTYHTDGGTVITDELYYAGDIPMRPDDPTKSGTYFINWYLDESYTTPYNFDEAFYADTTIYAKFLESIPIYDTEDLKAIADDPDAKYYLANDINMNGTAWTPFDFEGLLDGEGHKIYNFTLSSNELTTGFFGTNLGTLKNITFSDFVFNASLDVTGSAGYAGVIAAFNEGTIENCHVTDAEITFVGKEETRTTQSGYLTVGGMVGANSGTVIDCSIIATINYNAFIIVEGTNATVSASTCFGGLIGLNDNKLLNSSCELTIHAGAFIDMNNPNSRYDLQAFVTLCAGGGVGTNSGVIEGCNANTAIDIVATKTREGYSTTASIDIFIGGFAYSNYGEISACTASGEIKSASNQIDTLNAGGFAVYNNNSNILNCYTDIDVELSNTAFTDACYIGGFVAQNYATVSCCYSTGDITVEDNNGMANVGGFVGVNCSGASIAKCFNTGNIAFTTSYGWADNFVALAEDGSTIYKCYYNRAMTMKLDGVALEIDATTYAEGKPVAQLQSSALLIDQLGWNAEIWSVQLSGYPILAWEE